MKLIERAADGFKEFVSTYRAAYPDARITVNNQIAEGDKVATAGRVAASTTVS
jgi:predicted ester cyclase